MRAAIYNGQKNILLTELETPKAGDNDIVVRNLYASICRTDVAVYLHGSNTGHRVTGGGEFGHEMVSEVVQMGKNVNDIRLGAACTPPRVLRKEIPSAQGQWAAGRHGVLFPAAEKMLPCLVRELSGSPRPSLCVISAAKK